VSVLKVKHRLLSPVKQLSLMETPFASSFLCLPLFPQFGGILTSNLVLMVRFWFCLLGI